MKNSVFLVVINIPKIVASMDIQYIYINDLA